MTRVLAAPKTCKTLWSVDQGSLKGPARHCGSGAPGAVIRFPGRGAISRCSAWYALSALCRCPGRGALGILCRAPCSLSSSAVGQGLGPPCAIASARGEGGEGGGAGSRASSSYHPQQGPGFRVSVVHLQVLGERGEREEELEVIRALSSRHPQQVSRAQGSGCAPQILGDWGGQCPLQVFRVGPSGIKVSPSSAGMQYKDASRDFCRRSRRGG